MPDGGGRRGAPHDGLADRQPGHGHRRRAHGRGQVVRDARRRWPTCSAPIPRGIVFGRSMTQLTFDFAAHLCRELGAGRRGRGQPARPRRERPARGCCAAEAVGAAVRWVDFDPDTGELTAARRRRRAVRAAPGWSPDRRVQPDRHAARTRRRSPARCTTSARCSTSTACTSPRTRRSTWPRSGADFFACSPYKFLGPHCGVLAAAPELLETLHPDKLLPSTDAVPERFELGTLPVRAAGRDDGGGRLPRRAHRRRRGPPRQRLLAAMSRVEAHEDGLRERIEDGARPMPAVTVRSRARAADADAAAHVRRRPAGGRRLPFPRRARRQRPGRVVLRVSSRPGGSAWARRADCGSAWRCTPTTPTWTGCWPGSPSSSGRDTADLAVARLRR